MSDSTHTEGPFSHGFNLLANFESRDGLRTPVLLLEDEYNRARACWNACDGMEDPAIEIATLRAEVERLRIVADRVAGLNPDAGEIGAGMLVQLVDAARAALKGGA